MNPVFYFDELDKVSDTARGEEIIGILTHLTDTSQNNEFHDKYFSDVDFNLSKSLFIFSYNDETRINPILKDRMYCIQTNGYDTKEKIIIAKDYLLPKIREQVGFTEDEIIIPNETIEYIVGNKGITKEEDGVRNLKRCLEVIHTKLNLFRLVKMEEDNMFSKEIKMVVKFPFTVKKEDVDKLIKTEENQNQSVLNSMYL
jgi:ATP-dependent Lon protease